ncbi:type I-D CRISPR-associated protein Cas7/Csc2 [Cyanobacterium aponinum]|uniref:Type I-D CRISPR-associated protein Cas7/Csc2 n=1 Tax=Cyanobacterium aponinum 0216 TaxID=2676140 RepID=A0A844GRZ4_9CHRO|nr:type I-D CRISPR-associated protein Cas7/Csc2 [Cyanobacterium aponinum]MTF38313.1 type I-D CRISPR-associated protein Cas7/Csc2 [Cyanobacterium aponinum 0216]
MFKKYTNHFQETIPNIPHAKYAHFIVLKETDSYAVFKTDGGELNTARVRAGLENSEPITRLVLFKRKQTTPERLTGRELLRRYGVYDTISQTCLRAGKKKDNEISDCTYNGNPCGCCPDCVIYGYAVGESGSEKSKVFIDSAYAVPPYEQSHETLTLNAPYEDGTMTSGTDTTNRFSEQDHVIPEVPFPSVVTLRDPTPNTFLYVLNNLYRTKKYGAQTTRTGQVRNKLIAVIFADGEIFSNLRLTQKIYDLLENKNPPYSVTEIQEKAQEAVQNLITQDGVLYQLIMGDELIALKNEAQTILNDEGSFQQWLNAIAQETISYAEKVKVITRKNS